MVNINIIILSYMIYSPEPCINAHTASVSRGQINPEQAYIHTMESLCQSLNLISHVLPALAWHLSTQAQTSRNLSGICWYWQACRPHVRLNWYLVGYHWCSLLETGNTSFPQDVLPGLSNYCFTVFNGLVPGRRHALAESTSTVTQPLFHLSLWAFPHKKAACSSAQRTSA